MSRLLSPQSAEYYVVIGILIKEQLLLKPATVEKKFMHIHPGPRVAADETGSQKALTAVHQSIHKLQHPGRILVDLIGEARVKG